MANPATVYPNGVAPPPPRQHRNSSFCYWFCRILFIIILVTCFYFLSKIKNPPPQSYYSTPDFRFDSASFTSLDRAIGPNLTAKFDLAFTLTNPNNNTNISYEIIFASLDIDGDCGEQRSIKLCPQFCSGLFAVTQFPPFLQLNQSENTLRVQINAVDQFVGDHIVAARALGSIQFGLMLFTQFKTGYYTDSMQFYCTHMSFVFESNNATSASGTCLSGFYQL